MHETLSKIIEGIKVGRRKDATAATAAAIEQGVPPEEILAALTAGMDDVGRRFKANELFVPEVLVSARAMKQSMDLLEPLLTAAGIQPKHTVVLGTVEGDLHDIGKNLVGMMLKGANFRLIDLGVNIAPGAFVDAAKEHNADIVALSALLTTTMPSMRATVEQLRASGISVKVMVGGAPVTDGFAEQIGADGYAADAASAVSLARELVA
jgi:5-methyltetrahydrofolate--homocysteine methyltransferase